MTAQLGLGLAALGRPGYVTLNHARDLGGHYEPQVMEAHAHAVLDAAFDAGIRYVDAARSYGRAEDFLASWLRKRAIEPGQIVVASKWGYTYTANWATSATQHEVKDHSLVAYERQLAESVERLGRYLSVYQIHSVTAESRTLEDKALIDAIARLRDKGIRAGLSVSGAGQAVAIRRFLEVRRDGERVFDSVQATWNLLERGAESALQDAHDAGMKVVVKESLANGRLSWEAGRGEREEGNGGEVFAPSLSRVREAAESRSTTVEMLALAAALARPWADVVLTGAATVGQVQSNITALALPYDSGLEDQLRSASVGSAEYWRARTSFSWN
ncbi:MAG TPA: aldo/keto reductase [Gemmatimonadaceae bacterium]|jgi:aryl-alcohol dehydrogenase-like predicted oxidoreductase|nr:aldo/keto reductase [Gemmatimonadaceae bacterium]